MNKLVPDQITAIAKGKFLAYEDVRQSGLTNMWDSRAVCMLAEMQGNKLTEDDVLDIIKNYDFYAKKYLSKDKG